MPTSLSPEQRTRRARLAAHTRWAKKSEAERRAETEAARRAAMDRFEKIVDPDGQLPPKERAKRAANEKAAFYARLAFNAAQTKQRRKQADPTKTPCSICGSTKYLLPLDQTGGTSFCVPCHDGA